MNKIMKTFQRRFLMIMILCLLGLGAVTTIACAGRTKTATVTTQTTSGESGSGSTTSVTTQKEVTTDAHPRGVIGGVFYTIGQVLLFPFRVIGSLFS